MFKSTLIENHNYFKYKRIAFILMFISSAFMGFSTSMRSIALAWWIFILALLVIAQYYQTKLQSLVNKLSSSRKIEIDIDEIRIISKDNKTESFLLNKVEKVIIKDIYTMQTNDKVSVYNDFTGLISDNFLFIQKDGKLHKFEFVLPSYYMAEEIKIIINSWKKKGYKVEVTNKQS